MSANPDIPPPVPVSPLAAPVPAGMHIHMLSVPQQFQRHMHTRADSTSQALFGHLLKTEEQAEADQILCRNFLDANGCTGPAFKDWPQFLTAVADNTELEDEDIEDFISEHTSAGTAQHIFALWSAGTLRLCDAIHWIYDVQPDNIMWRIYSKIRHAQFIFALGNATVSSTIARHNAACLLYNRLQRNYQNIYTLGLDQKLYELFQQVHHIGSRTESYGMSGRNHKQMVKITYDVHNVDFCSPAAMAHPGTTSLTCFEGQCVAHKMPRSHCSMCAVRCIVPMEELLDGVLNMEGPLYHLWNETLEAMEKAAEANSDKVLDPDLLIDMDWQAHRLYCKNVFSFFSWVKLAGYAHPSVLWVRAHELVKQMEGCMTQYGIWPRLRASWFGSLPVEIAPALQPMKFSPNTMQIITGQIKALPGLSKTIHEWEIITAFNFVSAKVQSPTAYAAWTEEVLFHPPIEGGSILTNTLVQAVNDNIHINGPDSPALEAHLVAFLRRSVEDLNHGTAYESYLTNLVEWYAAMVGVREQHTGVAEPIQSYLTTAADFFSEPMSSDEEPTDGSRSSLYNSIMQLINQCFGGVEREIRRYAAFASSLIGLGIAIFNVVRTATSEKPDKLMLGLNAVLIATSAFTAYSCICEGLDMLLFDWIKEKVTEILVPDSDWTELMPVRTEVETPCSAALPKIIVKIVTVLGVAICSACGLKSPAGILKDVGMSLRAADTTVESVSTLLSEVFDIDTDGSHAEQKVLEEVEKRGQEFLSLTTAQWSVMSVKNDIDKWLVLANNLIRKPSKGKTNYNRLSALTLDVSKRLADVERIRTTGRERPVPCAIWLHGQPGRGKTDFVYKYLIPHLAAAFNVSGEVYDLGSGKYSMPLLNQRWAVYDEAGAKSINDDSVLGRLNNLLSSAPCVLPGAEVENKNQVANFACVIFMSNLKPSEVNFNMNDNAKNALLTRLKVFTVDDPMFNPQNPRDQQNHRQPDFSHLRFTDPGGANITAAGLIQEICIDIKIKSTYFLTTADKTIDPQLIDICRTIAGDGFKLPDPFDTETPTSKTPFTITISGAAGTRKTTQWAPDFQKAFDTFGFESITVPRGADPTWLDAHIIPGKRTLWIVDDLFDLTQSSECQAFLNFLNAIPAEDVTLVLTNYGPTSYKSWLPQFIVGAGPRAVSLRDHPGLARRLGFDKDRPEAVSIEATSTSLAFTTLGQPCTVQTVLSRYLQYTNRSCFVQHLETMPKTVPFTREEADIFVHLVSAPGIGSAAELFSKGRFSLRITPIIARLWPKVTNGDWFGTVKRELLNGTLSNMKDAKIFVSIPGKKFMYFKDTFYTDDTDTDYVVNFDEVLGMATISSVAYPQGRQIIGRQQYVSYVTKTQPASESPDDIAIFLALTEADKLQQPIWTKIVNAPKYKLSMSELLDMHHRIGQARLLAWYTIAKKYWQVGAFLGFIAVAAPLLWRFCGSSKQNITIVSPPCEWCQKKQLCPVIGQTQLMYDNDEIQVTAKGGRKGKLNRAGATLGNPKKFHFNNQYFVVSGADADLSENPTLERLYHDFHRRLQAGEVTERDDHWYLDLPSHGTAKAYARLSKAGGDWKIHMDDEPTGTNDPNLMTYGANVLFAETDSVFTVTMLDGTYGVTSAHCVEEVGQTVTIHSNGPHTALVLSIDRMHELAFLVAIDQLHNPKIIPGIKSMIPILCKRSEIPTHGYATVLTKRDNRFGAFTNKYAIQTVPCPMITAEKIKLWKEDAGIVSWGSALQPVAPGDSGSPVFSITKGGIRLIGIQAATKQSICQFLFAVMTKEHLQEATTSGEKPRAESPPPILDLQDCTSQVCYDAGIKVLLHEGFVGKVKAKKCFPMYLEGNSGQIGGVKNPLPMDTQNDRRPLANHMFAPIFGNLKSPAIPALRTAIDHADKIPPDPHGLRAPEHIKMCKLSSGFCVPEEVAFLTTTAATVLAEYYKMQCGVDKLEPLSVDKAINGTIPEKKLEMDSSTGAAFQCMFPGFPTKERLFAVDSPPGEPTHRRFQDSIPSRWLKQAIDEQWEGAKNCVVRTLPASASFKSELLPNEKVWKKRIVFVCDTATVINQKRILQPIMDVLTKDGPLSDFQLCMNPYRDFDAIGRRLQRTSTDGILSLDFKDFDLTIPGEVLLACGMFCAEFYSAESRALRKAVISLVGAIGATPILCEDSLYSKSHGMLSGVYGTSLLDCVAVKIMLYVVVSRLFDVEGLIPVEDFFEMITSIGCGDDTTMSVHHKARKVITFKALQEAFKECYNMTITADTKDGKDAVFTEITEATFCSRKWVVHPTHPQVLVSRLKPEAMSGALCWTAYSTDEQAKAQLEAMRPEFLGWGKEKFLHFERMFRTFCELNGQEYIPITWDTLAEEAYHAIVADNMPRHISTDLTEIPKTKDYKPDVKRVTDKIMELVGPSNPADMDVTTYPQNRRLAKVRAVFEDSTTLEGFTSCKLAQSLKNTIVLDSVVTRNIYASQVRYQFIDPTNLQWFQQLIFGFNEQLLGGLHTVADSHAPTPDRPGPSFRRYKKDRELARAILNAMGNRRNEGIFTYLKSCVMPEHCSGRGMGTSVDKPPVRAAPTTGSSGPTLAAISVSPAIVSEGAPSPPDAVSFTAQAPPVLVAAPGIDGSLAANTGYFRDVASYLFTPYITQNLTATTSTSEGTLIGSWDFDPWDEALVGPMVKKYADLHDTFVGSLIVKFQMPSVAMVSGRLAYFFVPGPHVDKVKPNIQSLSKYAGYIMEVTNTTGVGSDFEIVLSPSSNSDFVVTRESLKTKKYGRLYLLAYTLVQNSYGSNSVLPITMYSCLAPNSAYSNPIEADQDGTTVIPQLPVEAVTLSIDGLYPLPLATGDAVVPSEPHGKGESGIFFTPLIASYSSDVNTPSDVTYKDLVTGVIDHGTLETVTVSDLTAGKKAVYTIPDTNLEYNKNAITYVGASFKARSYVPRWGFETTPSQNLISEIRVVPSKVPIKTEEGEIAHFRTVKLSPKIKFIPDPPTSGHYQPSLVELVISGNVTCSEGFQTTRVGIPANYKRIALVPETETLPAVQNGIAGVTMMPGSGQYAAQKADREYFDKNPGVGSIITTLTTGNARVQIVRNIHGWWVYAPGLPDYANFTSVPEWEQSSVPSSAQWPVVAPIASNLFVTRFNSATGTAMIGAMLGGGLLSGIGQGLSSYANATNENNKLQTSLANSNNQLMYSAMNANNMAQFNALNGRYVDASNKKIQDEWTKRQLTFQNMNTMRSNDFNVQMFQLSQAMNAYKTVSNTRATTLGTDDSAEPAGMPTGVDYGDQVEADDEDLEKYLADSDSKMAAMYQESNPAPKAVKSPAPIPTPVVSNSTPKPYYPADIF